MLSSLSGCWASSSRDCWDLFLNDCWNFYCMIVGVCSKMCTSLRNILRTDKALWRMLWSLQRIWLCVDCDAHTCDICKHLHNRYPCSVVGESFPISRLQTMSCLSCQQQGCKPLGTQTLSQNPQARDFLALIVANNSGTRGHSGQLFPHRAGARFCLQQKAKAAAVS